MARGPYNKKKLICWQGIFCLFFCGIGLLLTYAAEMYMQATIFRTGAFDDSAYQMNDNSANQVLENVVDEGEVHLTFEDSLSEDQKVTIRKIADVEKEQLYNGEDLEDNGMPYAIKVNKQQNIVTVYKSDQDGKYTVPVKAMRCSVGPDDVTPTGTYTLTGFKYRWGALFGDVWGQYVYQIVGNILFHSVPYTEKSQSSLETAEYNKLGTQASMGCIRLAVIDVRWIYEHCEPGTQVNLFDSEYYGPMGKPGTLVTMDENSENAGWDPTDMDGNNPWFTGATFFGVEDRTIEVGEAFVPLAGVYAISGAKKDVTDTVMVSGAVDDSKAGTYPLIYSFMDGNKEIRKEITVTVIDEEVPVITAVPSDLAVNAFEADEERLTELISSYVTAYDNGKELDKKYLRFDFSKVDLKTGGTYDVVCYAKDASGNQSDKISIPITIDLKAPVISLVDKDNRVITMKQASSVDEMLALVTATDQGEDVKVYCSLPLTVSKDMPYKVMYYAKDACGNVATKYFSFTVLEDE